jgi:hypothetical protein
LNLVPVLQGRLGSGRQLRDPLPPTSPGLYLGPLESCSCPPGRPWLWPSAERSLCLPPLLRGKACSQNMPFATPAKKENNFYRRVSRDGYTMFAYQNLKLTFWVVTHRVKKICSAVLVPNSSIRFCWHLKIFLQRQNDHNCKKTGYICP